jgi:hypothetical protein
MKPNPADFTILNINAERGTIRSLPHPTLGYIHELERDPHLWIHAESNQGGNGYTDEIDEAGWFTAASVHELYIGDGAQFWVPSNPFVIKAEKSAPSGPSRRCFIVEPSRPNQSFYWLRGENGMSFGYTANRVTAGIWTLQEAMEKSLGVQCEFWIINDRKFEPKSPTHHLVHLLTTCKNSPEEVDWRKILSMDFASMTSRNISPISDKCDSAVMAGLLAYSDRARDLLSYDDFVEFHMILSRACDRYKSKVKENNLPKTASKIVSALLK